LAPLPKEMAPLEVSNGAIALRRAPWLTATSILSGMRSFFTSSSTGAMSEGLATLPRLRYYLITMGWWLNMELFTMLPRS
jgi:hypothetical protein